MLIFPAIDLYGGKAVRLYKGRYEDMTVYADDPPAVALDFKAQGAEYVHIVDLEGAKEGSTPNFDTVCAIKKRSGLFCEIGGGIRGMDTVERYLSAGIDRLILGTAAIEDETFLLAAVKEYGERIAVGADLKDGFIAVKGWLETSSVTAEAFFARMERIGVKTVICTDVNRDGAMKGVNLPLYRSLSEKYHVDITASGGVSSMEDVTRLTSMGLYAAIIGKACYTGAIDLREAVKAAQC